MSLNYFNDKKSEQKFMRLYNISEGEFYHSGIYEGMKVRQRYLCWKYLPNIRDKIIDNIPKKSKYEAVFLDFRSFPHIEFIIRNAIIKLGKDWSHTIICGNQNLQFMQKLCQRISPNIRLIQLNINNIDYIEDYNKLLTSVSFWNKFHGEKILIHQEDSCIFKSNVEDYLHFDYIGAPWNTDKEWVQQSGLKIAAGNGGFSIRTRKLMIQIIENYPRDSKDNEDVYFSRMIQDHNLGIFPSMQDCYNFSSEGVVSRESFGGHCYFNYDVESEKRFVKDCVISLYKDEFL